MDINRSTACHRKTYTSRAAPALSPRPYASADDIKTVVGTEPIDYDGFCRVVAELGHVCFCHAVDVEGVGRVWTPSEGDDPLRALFRVISSSKAFYAAQKHTAALW